MLYTITMSYGSHTLYGFTSTLSFAAELYNSSIITTMHYVLYNSICQYITIHSILYISKLYIICLII